MIGLSKGLLDLEIYVLDKIGPVPDRFDETKEGLGKDY